MLVGYARTSTGDQIAGFEAQIEQLTATGCNEKMFKEQVSSIGAREQLDAALEFVRDGDTLVVDNDGLHGMGAISGGVGLKAGLHPLVIHMFQKKGGEGLELRVDGPGMPEQTVPPEWLFHAR